MRRWIILSFFIGALLLFVSGWVASGSFDGVITYTPNQYIIGKSPYTDDLKGMGTHFLGFQFVSSVKGEANFYVMIPFWFPTALYGTPYSVVIAVPHWFLITISASALFIVWRKTRPKAKGRAFPVELSGASDKP